MYCHGHWMMKPIYPARTTKKGFKEEHPDCPFSVSTITHEFPQNAIMPTSRHLERNICPFHANVRQMINCLHKVSSCRQMASKSMCDTADIDPSDPLTWQPDCVFGNCPNCPVVNIKIPGSIKNKVTCPLNQMMKICHQKKLCGQSMEKLCTLPELFLIVLYQLNCKQIC